MTSQLAPWPSPHFFFLQRLPPFVALNEWNNAEIPDNSSASSTSYVITFRVGPVLGIPIFFKAPQRKPRHVILHAPKSTSRRAKVRRRFPGAATVWKLSSHRQARHGECVNNVFLLARQSRKRFTSACIHLGAATCRTSVVAVPSLSLKSK